MQCQTLQLGMYSMAMMFTSPVKKHSCATFNEATVNLVSLVNAGTTSTPAQGEYCLIIISVNEQNQAEQPEKRAVQTTFKRFFSSL